MFTSESRIEHVDSGIRFYEQDVIMSSYVFSGDWVVDIYFDYLAPGFGILFCDKIDQTEVFSKFCYLYKMGCSYKNAIGDFIHYKRHGDDVEQTAEALFVLPGSESINQHMQLIMEEGKILIKLERINSEGEDISEIFGPYDFPYYEEKYYIGIYSAAGNIIKRTKFSYGTPEHWWTSISNTFGGRISFFLDGFKFENCLHDAEIEQSKVSLEPGTYFLLYDQEPVDEKFDIQCVVFKTELPEGERKDKDFEDEIKQLRDPTDGSFILRKATSINVKFKGTNGIIKNVRLTNEREGSYIRTYGERKLNERSWMDIKLDGLSKIEWTGCIKRIPEWNDLSKPCPYAVLAVTKLRLVLMALNIELNKLYDFEYDVALSKLTVWLHSNGKKFPVSVPLVAEDNNTIRIFENLDGFISRLVLTDINEKETDMIILRKFYAFIPSEINSPIIVVDEKERSLDLSASYREIINEGYRIEYFNRFKPLEVSNDIIKSFNSAELYGIPYGATVNKNATTIEKYCSKAVKIKNTLFTLQDGFIAIDSDERKKYKALAMRYQSQEDFSYWFTTSEREVFDNSNRKLILEHKILNNSDAIQIYGIFNDAEIDESKIYRIPDEGMMHSIDFYTDQYESIMPYNFEVDYAISVIYLDPELLNKYKYFIVDYDKENSYSINFVSQTGNYLVESTSSKAVPKVVYDMNENGVISNIIETKIMPDRNKYIVVRKN